MGRVLLPAAAILTLAGAVAYTMAADSVKAHSALMLHDMAISAPIIMPEAGGAVFQPGNAISVLCELHTTTGALMIGHTPMWGSQHMAVTATAHVTMCHREVVTARQNTYAATSQDHTVLHSGLANLAQAVLPAAHAQGIVNQSTSGLDAFGQIESVDDCWHMSGCLTSPQQIDSALHLGVVKPGSGAKIPVAVAVYTLPTAVQASCCGQMNAAKTPSQLFSGRTATSGTELNSFWLWHSDAGGQRSAVVVKDLQTKVMSADTTKQHQAAVEEQQPATYQVDWFVSACVGHASGNMQVLDSCTF